MGRLLRFWHQLIHYSASAFVRTFYEIQRPETQNYQVEGHSEEVGGGVEAKTADERESKVSRRVHHLQNLLQEHQRLPLSGEVRDQEGMGRKKTPGGHYECNCTYILIQRGKKSKQTQNIS